MTTSSCPKPITLTSQRFDRTSPVTALRGSNAGRVTAGERTGAAGAAKRFLSVLMNSLSMWAV
jgi:hypothetical protein